MGDRHAASAARIAPAFPPSNRPPRNHPPAVTAPRPDDFSPCARLRRGHNSLQQLAGRLVLVDICALAIMSNDVHLVLRTKPDLAGQWTDQEVARRWWNLAAGRSWQIMDVGDE